MTGANLRRRLRALGVPRDIADELAFDAVQSGLQPDHLTPDVMHVLLLANLERDRERRRRIDRSGFTHGQLMLALYRDHQTDEAVRQAEGDAAAFDRAAGGV